MSLNKENFPNFEVKHTSTSDFINRENFNLPAIDELSSEIEPLKNELYQLFDGTLADTAPACHHK
jgi:hypothetical protein